MRQSIAVLFLSLCALTPVIAHATPITYTLSTTASGDLGGVSFTDALVTITVDSDTADVDSGAGYIYNPATDGADLSIAGFSPTTFSSSMDIFYANGGNYYVGIEDELGPFLFAEVSNGFAGYNLASSLGPLIGATNQDLGSNVDTPTAAGNFFLTSDSGDTTFTATLNSTASPTPEPSTICLFGTGAVVMLGTARRRLKP
jgi:PEP-CTERM motif